MRFYRWTLLLLMVVVTLIIVIPASAQDLTPIRASDHFLQRCLNAGFTMQECRRIYDRLYEGAERNFAERCLNAGYTNQQCRRLYNALYGDDSTLAVRCRLAGLTSQECRRLLNAAPNPDLSERCRAAGLSPEQCRRLLNDGSYTPPVDPPVRDQATAAPVMPAATAVRGAGSRP